MATTLTAQQVISTTETTFEAFLADNFFFIDVNECFFWLNCVIDEEYELDPFVNIISLEKVYDRLKSRFMVWKDDYHDVLWAYLKNLKPDDWTRIYYKNNLINFINDHDDMKSLIEKVFRKVENTPTAKCNDDIPVEYRLKYPTAKKYNVFVNERKFMNPNVIPDTVKTEMDLINTLCMKYVYIPFLAFDRIYRLKYFERKAVIIVDTDSNILNCTPWIEYCQQNIMKSEYGRDEMDNVFIGVNTITYMLTNVVGNILMFYGEHAHIPEKFRSRFTMKNEFFFTKLIVGRKKKRYVSMIKLREGNIYNPERFDIKGFDFMKSGTSEKASELYSRLTKEKLLMPETPDIKGLMAELRVFEKEIRRDLEHGHKTYLPIVNVKEDAAYKPEKIWSIQSKKAVFCWNAIYPDNTIELPSKVNILKLNIFRESDLDGLQQINPELHERIINKVFHSRNEKIAKTGLQVIAIPSNVDIPIWLIPYISYDTIINNILKQFGSVLEMVDIPYVKVGKTINGIDRKSKKFSNIINF